MESKPGIIYPPMIYKPANEKNVFLLSSTSTL